jgi:hypothetical protein
MLEQICASMASYSASWWIAGGWAIDLHLGKQSRPHQDVDVAVLRRDQQKLRAFLADWSLYKSREGALTPWLPGEELILPVHVVHAKQGHQHLELLLNEATRDLWLFRRSPAISLPLERLSCRTPSGIPYLCPEVVLLYKAKAPRPVDFDDFERALPYLEDSRRAWLAGALRAFHPGHEWISLLTTVDRDAS